MYVSTPKQLTTNGCYNLLQAAAPVTIGLNVYLTGSAGNVAVLFTPETAPPVVSSPSGTTPSPTTTAAGNATNAGQSSCNQHNLNKNRISFIKLVPSYSRRKCHHRSWVWRERHHHHDPGPATEQHHGGTADHHRPRRGLECAHPLQQRHRQQPAGHLPSPAHSHGGESRER